MYLGFFSPEENGRFLILYSVLGVDLSSCFLHV